MNFNRVIGRLVILCLLLIAMFCAILWVSHAQNTNDSKRTNGILVSIIKGCDKYYE